MGKKKKAGRGKKAPARPQGTRRVPLHVQIEERYDRQGGGWAGYLSTMSCLRNEAAEQEMAASMRRDRKSEREIEQALEARRTSKKGSGVFVGFF